MLTILILLISIAWSITRVIKVVNRHMFPYDYNRKMGLPGYDKAPLIKTWDMVAFIFLLLAVMATISRCTYL